MNGPDDLSAKSELGNTHPKSARSIQEFWIDFLLEEEFRVDPGFVASFIANVIPGTTSRKVEKVVHSMTDKYGEADLAVFLKEATTPSFPGRHLIIDHVSRYPKGSGFRCS